MIKWEYTYAHIKSHNRDDTIKVLDEFGQEGWEAVAGPEGLGHGAAVLMKRPIKPFPLTYFSFPPGALRGNNDPMPPKPEGDDPRSGDEYTTTRSESAFMKWARGNRWNRRNI